MKFNKRIKVNFDGGELSGDAGLLLFKEFDEAIGLSRAIKDKVVINDGIIHRKHSNHDVIMQKIYQNAAGYHADNHANSLKSDPALTIILNKNELASQPTMSRLNQRLSKSTMKQFQDVNRMITDCYQVLAPPEVLVLDIDSSNSPTYGNQYGSSFNYHYGENGYHPIFMFDGETGDCLKATLRSGNVYTSRGVVSFVGPELKRFKRKYPDIKIIIRGDSGFATPELYMLCEELNIDYVIRLKANQRLQKIASEFEDEIISKVDIYDGHHVYYKEFIYKAASWNTSR